MFLLEHNKNTNTVAISNSKKGFSALLMLNEGGSLQQLTIDNEHIIKLLDPKERKLLFSSAILFPFAGRVKNNQYSFQGEPYTLKPNQKNESMALHGFVYDKTFEIVDSNLSKESATLSLKYTEPEEAIGFPYKYSITFNYEFTESSVRLDIHVKNESIKPFPFSIGWHPYFASSDLEKSTIKLKSNEQIVYGKDLTPQGTEQISASTIHLANKKLDNGYLLNGNGTEFITPDYKLEISSSNSAQQYLQLYTPGEDNRIVAIEPLTAPANSFNNQMGLQVLEPNNSYQITFGLNMSKVLKAESSSKN